MERPSAKVELPHLKVEKSRPPPAFHILPILIRKETGAGRFPHTHRWTSLSEKWARSRQNGANPSAVERVSPEMERPSVKVELPHLKVEKSRPPPAFHILPTLIRKETGARPVSTHPSVERAPRKVDLAPAKMERAPPALARVASPKTQL